MVSCTEEGSEPEAPAGESVLPSDVTSPRAPPFEDMAGQLNGAIVRGEVTATNADGAVVVVIEASDLPDPREYPAYLYRGTCAESQGESVALTWIVTLPDLTGSSTTVVDATMLVGDAPIAVRIFASDGMSMACGELSPRGISTGGAPSLPSEKNKT